jgi:hypothetical protein
MKTWIAAATIAVFAGPAAADVLVRFDESAPKDRFTIRNESNCQLSNAVLTLNLGASAAGLIFDVTGAGAGVEVFQPLELVSGSEFLEAVPEVKDGDSSVVLPVATLAPGAEIAFTIDVDDTLGTRATMISGAEIAGAMVTLQSAASISKGAFGEDAVARVVQSACNA